MLTVTEIPEFISADRIYQPIRHFIVRKVRTGLEFEAYPPTAYNTSI